MRSPIYGIEKELPLLLARAEFQLPLAKEWQDLATQAIESGLDAPELHEVAWDTVLAAAEAKKLMSAALPKLGWRQPERDEAVAILLHHYCSEIAYGGADLLDTFRSMIREVVEPASRGYGSSIEAGEAHDMTALIRDHYLYEHLAECGTTDREKESFLSDLRRHAAERLLRHPMTPSLKIAGTVQ